MSSASTASTLLTSILRRPSGSRQSLAISAPIAVEKPDIIQSELQTESQTSLSTIESQYTYPLGKDLNACLKESYTDSQLSEGLNVRVPRLVHECCAFIDENEPLEGIFRVNGYIKKVKQLEKKIMENPNSFDFKTLIHQTAVDQTPVDQNINQNQQTQSEFEQNYEITGYDVAMVLKRFLNNLDSCLITPTVYEVLTKQASPVWKDSSMSAEPSGDDLVSADALALYFLPQEHLHLLLFMLRFLNSLTRPSFAQASRMTSGNFAKVFQPTFFKSTFASSENLLQDFKRNESMLQRWIDNYSKLVLYISSHMKSSLSGKVEICKPAQSATLPKQRGDSMASKKSKRLSMFGFRSSSTPQPLSREKGKRSVSSSKMKMRPNSEFFEVRQSHSTTNIHTHIEEDTIPRSFGQSETSSPIERKPTLARRLSVRFGLNRAVE